MFPFLSALRNLSIFSILFRFGLCIICGGVLGFEREKRMHAAGLRTYTLVCLGAASVMLVSQYIYTYLGQSIDTSRIASQVVSGIGFLGAGTIIVTGTRKITGLTTAAGLWAAACMGLAIGIGFYECALLLCAAVYFSLKILNIFERKYINDKNLVGLFIEHNNEFKISTLFKTMESHKWIIYSLNPLENSRPWGGSLKIVVSREHSGEKFDNIVGIIRELDGVMFVKESDF